MKQIICIYFILFNILTFGQINNPSPNFDIENVYEKTETPGDKWDYSKKPYKKITSFEYSKCIDEFDSIGRHTKRSVFWNDFTTINITKYKDDKVVEFTLKRIYNLNETGNISVQMKLRTQN